ncbi:MAG: NAD(P)-dependent oxidoreductase [Acidimicrobiales bacterium]
MPLRILFADAIDQERLTPLLDAGVECIIEPGLTADDLPNRIVGFDGLIVRSTKVLAETIDAADRLQFIVRAGAGVDNIDCESASALGVFVCNVPGRNAVAVAELTMGLLLSCDRRIADNTADLRNGVWQKGVYSVADGVLGKTMGIIGLGEIGLQVALRAKAFGLTVLAVRKDGRSDLVQQRIRSIGVRMVDELDELLAEADIVSIHVPKAESTAGMVNASFLSKMKPSSILLNTSRGEVVNEADLLVALDQGLRAGLDVFADEPKSKEGSFSSAVASHPNVVGTHHIGASTAQAQQSVADGTVQTIEAFISGSPVNVVNMNTQPRGTATLIIKHLDRVGVLASVFALLRSHNVNVQEMENQLFSGSNGAAVATMHVSHMPPQSALEALSKLEHVLNVTTTNS